MADPARGGPGERAFFMAEKFGFDEVGGDGAAIDRRKGLAGADAFVVDRAGDEFLARARRSAEHDRCVRPCHAAAHVAQMPRPGAAADDPRFPRRLVAAHLNPLPHFRPIGRASWWERVLSSWLVLVGDGVF